MSLGKDEDYFGGKALRGFEDFLHGIGLPKESSLNHALHGIEHWRRGVCQEMAGNHENAEKEFERSNDKFHKMKECQSKKGEQSSSDYSD